MHPKQIEGAIQRQLRNKTRADFKSKGREISEKLSLSAMHFPPSVDDGRKYGLSIVYSLEPAGNVVTVATALCHPDDEFIKDVGRYYAAVNFEIGNNVMLRIPAYTKGDKYAVKSFLAQTFDHPSRKYGEQ